MTHLTAYLVQVANKPSDAAPRENGGATRGVEAKGARGVGMASATPPRRSSASPPRELLPNPDVLSFDRIASLLSGSPDAAEAAQSRPRRSTSREQGVQRRSPAPFNNSSSSCEPPEVRRMRRTSPSEGGGLVSRGL